MGTVTKFTDIIAWKHAHEYVLMVYAATKHFPNEERYAVSSQIQRAAVSVPANIAEGFSHKTKKERLRFYEIAKSSLEETKYYIILSKDLGYISVEQGRKLYAKANEIGKTLQGWMAHTR